MYLFYIFVLFILFLYDGKERSAGLIMGLDLCTCKENSIGLFASPSERILSSQCSASQYQGRITILKDPVGHQSKLWTQILTKIMLSLIYTVDLRH